jgi:hypothetical protein
VGGPLPGYEKLTWTNGTGMVSDTCDLNVRKSLGNHREISHEL